MLKVLRIYKRYIKKKIKIIMASPLEREKGHTVLHEHFTVNLVLSARVCIGGFVLPVLAAGVLRWKKPFQCSHNP